MHVSDVDLLTVYYLQEVIYIACVCAMRAKRGGYRSRRKYNLAALNILLQGGLPNQFAQFVVRLGPGNVRGFSVDSKVIFERDFIRI